MRNSENQVSGSSFRRLAPSQEGLLWLLAAAALWLTGWVKGINLILLLAYLLLALWLLNWWLARRALRGLAARRVAGGPIFAGTPSPWHVDVSSTARAALTGWDLVDASTNPPAAWFVPQLPPGSRIRLREQVCFPRRGVQKCRPLRAISAYPFGLFQREEELGEPETAVVYPAVGTINVSRLRRWLQHAARPDERHRRARRRLAHEIEFHSLRSFRPGDSPRWIHWRTSARRGELMVREFDQGCHYDLLLIVEPLVTEGAADVEATISLAATIAWNWSNDSGDRIVLGAAGREPVIVAGSGGPTPAEPILAALAELEGTPNADLDALASRLEDRPLPAGPAVVVSGRPTEPALADRLAQRFNRPVAWLNAADPPDFYTPPAVGPRTTPCR